jgi:hypothetical protein
MSLGRAADAERLFADAMAKGGTSIYSTWPGSATCRRSRLSRKYDDAIKDADRSVWKRDGKLPVDGVLMELARVCRKAGKLQEARAAFKRVVDEFPESGLRRRSPATARDDGVVAGEL